MSIIGKVAAQQIVDSIKEICGQNINFIDEKGIIIASTDFQRIGAFHEIGYQVVRTKETIEVVDDNEFHGTKKGINLPIFHNGKAIAAVGISGDVDQVRKYAYLAQKITSIILKERELDLLGTQKKNRLNYMVRSLIYHDHIQPEFLEELLSEHQLTENTYCRLVLVRLNAQYNPKNLFMIQNTITGTFEYSESKLYAYEYPNKYILIMKATDFKKNRWIFEQLAENHSRILTVSAGCSTALYQIADSYQCAKLAAACQKKEGQLMVYDELDFELLIGNVSEVLRKQYLQKTLSRLGDTEKKLLRVYFDEDMSLQKTCERLYMHKNSLQYKLNRIAELSGYNPRNFTDAVVLYSALKLEQR